MSGLNGEHYMDIGAHIEMVSYLADTGSNKVDMRMLSKVPQLVGAFVVSK